MKWSRASGPDASDGDGTTVTDAAVDTTVNEIEVGATDVAPGVAPGVATGVAAEADLVGSIVIDESLLGVDPAASAGADPSSQTVTSRTAMRRINLLPPEVIQERHDARVRKLVFVGLGGLVGLLAVVWLLTSFQGASVRSDLAAQKKMNAQLERQIESDELQEPVRKKEDLEERVAALGSVLGQEVAFPRMLRELSRVMPPTMYLDSVDLTVPVQQAAKKKSSSSSKSKKPTIADFSQELKLDARASGGMDLTADWLDRTKGWPAVERAWLNDQAKVPNPKGGEEIDFSSSLQLNNSILSERAQRLAKGELP